MKPTEERAKGHSVRGNPKFNPYIKVILFFFKRTERWEPGEKCAEEERLRTK